MRFTTRPTRLSTSNPTNMGRGLTYAVWHDHLVGSRRAVSPVERVTAPPVSLDFATWRAHLAGLARRAA
jgi:hypothetical protein